MEYEITAERQAYLETHGHLILSACPGSGKTTSIVKKLKSISDFCTERYGQHTGFACLSFTNKACTELQQRYWEMHNARLIFPNIVATIDSFIMQTVVLPFWYLCDACKKRPIIVNDKDVLERIYYNNVFQNGEWHQYVVRELRAYNNIIHRKIPSSVTKEKGGYNWNHHPVTTPQEIAYCDTVFKYRVANGYITSNDALWIACDILEHHSEVANAIVSRYPYIIVDEAQDNSALHFDFFILLRNAGLQNLEFVGDICQSIYGFRDAKPDLLQRMMTGQEWTVLPMSECRRSNQRIINLYSKLKPSILPNIVAQGVEDKGAPIIVYKYNDENIRDIIQDFYLVCNDYELESRVVLARGLDACKKLGGVRDVEFKYWNTEIPYLLIDAVFAFKKGNMDEAFCKIRYMLATFLGGNDAESRRQYIHQISNDIEINAKIYSFLQIIPSFSLSFSDWAEQTTKLIQTYWELDEQPIFKPFKRKKGYSMREMAQVAVEQYCLAGSNDDYHKRVDTIHAVKGATIDAVLLFLSKDSRGQNISLNDFPQGEVQEMSEGQRMIYVACSRATQCLTLAVPLDTTDQEIGLALNGINYEIRLVNLQADLRLE